MKPCIFMWSCLVSHGTLLCAIEPSCILYKCLITYRNFLPSMEEFFEEAIEQADPEAMIEDAYK